MMRIPRLCLWLILAAVVPLSAAPDIAAPRPDRVAVDPVSTSIYVGSVALSVSELVRTGDIYSATYEAKVWPWFFWNETGRLTLTIPASDFERLNRGERVDFRGEAANHKNKPRTISGWAERHDTGSGKIKVRIRVDGTELIFNSIYHITSTGR